MGMIKLDFDGSDANQLVQDAFDLADSVQEARHRQFQRDFLLYKAFIDPRERDVDMPNVSLPKMFSIVETKAATDTAALFGRRPVIPIKARRDEFKEAAEIQTEVLDELLHKAGIYVHGALLVKLKILYGTAFMNVLPYNELIDEKQLLPDGSIGTIQQARLRLKLETWAPWEVMVDPHAKNLVDFDGCRFVIKVQLASKRSIKQIFERNGYPGLDLELLDDVQTAQNFKNQPVGQRILSAFGLPMPTEDDDMGIILRYESPDRWIDSWMGQIPLRDIDNQFKHKRINLSKMSHITEPHTQSQFWGIGEAKPNEIQIAMLNDVYNMTFASHAMVNQPMVFYRKGAVTPEDIIFGIGQRIPVISKDDRPISDAIQVEGGQGLPRDHYLIPNALERNIDLTAQLFGPQRGEQLSGDTTATEVRDISRNASKAQEMSIKLGEQEFLADFATKVTSIIDQFKNMLDIAEIVGPDKAIAMISANPADLPGGHNFAFKGSDSIEREAIERENAFRLAPILIESPTARPGGVERHLMETFDIKTEDMDQMQLTEEEIQAREEQQRQLAVLQMLLESQANAGGQQPAGAKPKQSQKQIAGNA